MFFPNALANERQSPPSCLFGSRCNFRSLIKPGKDSTDDNSLSQMHLLFPGFPSWEEACVLREAVSRCQENPLLN